MLFDDISIKSASDIENVKHDAGDNQCFAATVPPLPLSHRAGL